jgi:phytoene dehydrogenase-like protein
MLNGDAPPALIVGGGLAGLLLAMRLAQRGHAVDVFEKNATFGGYNGRDAGTGTPLVCYTALGLEPEGGLYRNLVEHDIWRGPAPRRMEVCDHLVCGGQSLPLPGRFDELQAWLCDRHCPERASIGELFDTMRRCHDAIAQLSNVVSAGRRAQAYACLAQYGRESFRRRIESSFKDAQLRRILSLRAFSSANTTSTMAAYLARILIDGLYHVPGSGAALTDMIVDYLERQPHVGMHAASEVVEILLDEGSQAMGVRIAGGRTWLGEVIVNIDPLDVGRRLVQRHEVSEAIERAGAGSSASLSALCFVFDVDPSLGRALGRYADTARVVLCDEVDPFQVLEARERGALDLRICKVNFDRSREGLVERVHVEIDCSAAAADWARMGDAQSPAMAPLVAQVRTRLQALEPDFADGIGACQVLTPATFGRLTGNRGGAASGFADAVDRPRQVDKALFGHGMGLVGQWALYGSGLSQLDMSASHAYRILRINAQAAAVRVASAPAALAVAT